MNEEWKISTLGELAERITTKNEEGYDRVLSVSAEHGLVDQEQFFTKRVASKNLSAYTVVRPGDYVYNKSYSKDAPLGVIARNLDDEPGVVSPLYIAFRLKTSAVVDGFLDHAVHSPVFAESLRGLLKEGGRAHGALNVKVRDFFSSRIPLPPLAAQRRIVDLMEHLDNQMKALSGQELAAADLACQLRRETFVKLAESRPLVRVDTMFDMLLGRQKSARQSVGDYVYPYIRAANIGTQGWRLDDLQTMNFDPREQAKYGVHEDDVLLVEGGSIGGVQRWSGEIGGFVGFDKHVIRLRATADRSTSEYALQWCHWSRESGAFEEQATGITIKALGFGRASAMPIPDISLAEQVEMMTPLAAADDVTVGLRTEILKLTDLRTALLTLLLDGSREVPESYHELLGVRRDGVQ